MNNGAQTSQQLREKGNALYKKGKLTEAIKTYQDAARHAAIDDYLPWSNLSAAYFETGQYEESTKTALHALALCNKTQSQNGNDSDSTASSNSTSSDSSSSSSGSSIFEQKLAPRVIRAYLHARQYAMARLWLGRYKASSTANANADELRQYRESLDHAEAVCEAFPDEKSFRRALAAEVPRYRPAFAAYNEFYNVGHDEITDLVDFSVLSDMKRDVVSMFFAGIGDARHFYGQLAMMGISERVATNAASPIKRRYHFSLNDVKAGVFARDLVLFTLLDELAVGSKDSLPQTQRTELYTVVYFLFLGVLIPRFALERLHATIDTLVHRLEAEDGSAPVLPWLHVYAADRPEIVRALKSWKAGSPLTAKFNTELIIQGAVEQAQNATMMLPPELQADRRAPPGCHQEMEMYTQVPFLQPPRSVLKEHEPELLNLLEEQAPSSSKKQQLTQNLKSYVAKHWVTNPTLLDEDWHVKAQGGLDVGWDPFEIYRALYNILSLQEKGGPRKTKLFDHVSSFFQMVVVALRKIRGRLTAEFLLGDAAAVIDGVRHSFIEGRDATAPNAFDLVHLSNVPDYIGGSFFTMTTAGKILSDAPAAKLKTTCLRNTSVWLSEDLFHSEYMAVSDSKMLSRVTGLHLTGREVDFPTFPMSGYTDWKRSRPAMKTIPYEGLLSRADLNRYCFTYFLKVALPRGRNPAERTHRHFFVYPALNLSSFFHLLIHLHETGYPAHWLADVLGKILDNEVVTTARPPRSHPLEPAEITQHNAPAAVCVAPFVAEVSTLTTLFQRILPFTPLSTKPNALPSLDTIYQYSIPLEWIMPPPNGEPAAMMLVFFDIKTHNLTPNRLHDDLDSTLSSSSSTLKRFREQGCVVVTSFTWTGVTGDQTVRFWMRADVMDRIQEESHSWLCGVWRVDDWMPLSTCPAFVSSLVKGKRWVDVHTNTKTNAVAGADADVEMEM